MPLAIRRALPYDDDGHGTHVSGTIGQLTNEQISARSVVDGLAVYAARGAIPYGSPELAVDPGDRDAIDAIVAAIADEVDATADLLTTEAVYQAIQGNNTAAAATLSTLAGDGAVPRPRVIEMPRSGIAFTS